jgi:hypothetical protein
LSLDINNFVQGNVKFAVSWPVVVSKLNQWSRGLFQRTIPQAKQKLKELRNKYQGFSPRGAKKGVESFKNMLAQKRLRKELQELCALEVQLYRLPHSLNCLYREAPNPKSTESAYHAKDILPELKEEGHEHKNTSKAFGTLDDILDMISQARGLCQKQAKERFEFYAKLEKELS